RPSGDGLGLRDGGRERVADLARRAGGGPPGGDVGGDGALHTGRGVAEAEVLEQEGDREHGGGRVGLALAGDVRRGAVDRLEHARCGAVGVDVAGRGQADAAGDGRGEVGDDVAEEVVGDDDVEACGVRDEEN